MKVIYIAGPLETGHYLNNVRAAIEAAEMCAEMGLASIVPHTMGMAWHLMYPKSKAEWLKIDKALVAKCDAVVRLEGASEGADEECRFAAAKHIPIYDGIADLQSDRRRKKGIFDER